MGRIWTEENKYRCWLQVESAASTVLAEDGVIPADGGRGDRREGELLRRAHSGDRGGGEARRDRLHDRRGRDPESQGLDAQSRWLHYGLTSNDVVDTAQALQVKEASVLIRTGLVALMAVLKRRALEFKHTPPSAARTGFMPSRRPSGSSC